MQRDDVIHNAPGSSTCQHTSVEVACLHACNHVREREGTDGLTHRYDSSLMGWCFVLSRIEGHAAVEAHSSISVLELNAINQVNCGGRGVHRVVTRTRPASWQTPFLPTRPKALSLWGVRRWVCTEPTQIARTVSDQGVQ